MTPYTPPVADMLAALRVAGVATLNARIDAADVEAILDQAARFACDVLAPLDRVGDLTGATRDGDVVSMPPGFRDAYAQWIEAGWNAVDAPEADGGMGLPATIASPLMEMWTSACMSFGLGPVLSQGAAEVLSVHGSSDLKAAFLSRLVSGEWMATMNITEPGAGSDVAQTKTIARAAEDGSFRLFGEKIFITYGEHDLTPNIVHLVLARTEGAPPGTRGLSLFLVPKFLPDADGNPGARNDVKCTGIEGKLGIHASPTCTMRYGDDGDGAIGWRVGPEHGGLACMFTMMNRARLATGLQSVAVAERATQAAWRYAAERRQGRTANAPDPVAIIAHPDVRRMLLDMRAGTVAARLLAYFTAASIDHAHGAADSDAAREAASRAALLTPVVKAWCSDLGFATASLGVQIFGGAGYVEETGIAQHLRDSRIQSIYEGTNGIQAIDLVTRKVVKDGGEALFALLAELSVDEPHLAEAIEAVRLTACWLCDAERSEEDRLAGASTFLAMVGDTVGGALLARAARLEALADATTLYRFFAATRLASVPCRANLVRDSSNVIPVLAP